MKIKKKRILITAGATTVPIDRVRAITNIFKGRTGTEIAKEFARHGHDVTLITSSPFLLFVSWFKKINVIKYHTYDELYAAMEKEITGKKRYDIVIHSAAVSDYKVAGTFIKDENGQLIQIDSSGKVSSNHEEMFLRLIPTEKIINKIRRSWGFSGYLVKFKLQVGITDNELREIADESREESRAEMIVANCLEWAHKRAEIRTKNQAIPVLRKNLAKALRKELE
jgi:phosphopantothenoylcysteine synthetase/decarboxylase